MEPIEGLLQKARKVKCADVAECCQGSLRVPVLDFTCAILMCNYRKSLPTRRVGRPSIIGSQRRSAGKPNRMRLD